MRKKAFTEISLIFEGPLKTRRYNPFFMSIMIFHHRHSFRRVPVIIVFEVDSICIRKIYKQIGILTCKSYSDILIIV